MQRSTGSRRRLARGGSVSAILLAFGLLAAACNPGPPSQDYVALGDSFTSGPGIPTQLDFCGRSSNNYPSLASIALETTDFVDMSCNGAEVPDIYADQIGALKDDTGLVSIGIGGNDIGFSDIVLNCITVWPWDPGCKGDYVSAAGDTLSDEIWAILPDIEGLIAEVQTRSPGAIVLLVGYPAILPDDPAECDALMPLRDADIVYLREKNIELNDMLEAAAMSTGVTYVDAYTSSIDHDFCQNDATKWVEALVPTDLAAPVHPNADGMANTALQVTAAAEAAGF